MAVDLDNLTLSLEGEVSVDDFANGVMAFRRLISAIGRREGGNKTRIEWMLSGLEYGSATVNATGYSANMDAVAQAVAYFPSVGRAIEAGNLGDLPSRIRGPAEELASLIDGRVTAVTFQTPAEEVVVRAPGEGWEPSATVTALGAIEGRIQTLSNRRGVRFTLYDHLNDRSVACYLERNQQDMLRELWGRRVLVEGMLTRDSATGRPLAIRSIRVIEPLPESEQGDFMGARGVLAGLADEPAEVTIRRLRDAW